MNKEYDDDHDSRP